MKNTQFLIYFKIIILTILSLPMIGQSFVVNLSSDTILAGNVLNVSFVAENIAGQFEGPDLSEFNVISGPNTSTSMSMINGDVTQSASYSYMILTEEVGELIVLPAYLDTGSETFETEPVSVLVLPNPEGIIEQAPSQSRYFEFGFPQTKPMQKPKTPTAPKKKKRKLKKI